MLRNTFSKFLYWIIFLVVFNVARANATIMTWQDHDLVIGVSSPPALIFVNNSLNQISGADPTKGLDTYGNGTILQEIPTSFVTQDNIGSDSPNGASYPSQYTTWTINIYDHPSESLMVNLQGMTTGNAELLISANYWASNIPSFGNSTDILITSGVTKQVLVTFDPTNKSLTTTPIISNGGLLQDTQIACTLGDVGPAEACEVLETIASEVEKSITQGNTNAEAIELNLYLLVLNRLHNWGNPGSIQNWGNCNGYSECLPLCNKGLNGTSFFAKDPAYSALELDGQTLLNALLNQGKSQGGGNQGGGNQGGNQGGQGNQGGSNQGGPGNNGGSNQGDGNQGNQGSNQGSNGNQGNGGNQGGQENQDGGNQGNH